MDITKAFLTNHAAKQFVALRALARHAHETRVDDSFVVRSCFVVEVEGTWFLLTAAHVLDGIREALGQGVEFSGWALHDEAAGHSFSGGVPIHFDANDWLTIRVDSRGLDYAATVLPVNVAAQLEAGGVQPICEDAWGYVPPMECDAWLVVGMPTESLETVGSKTSGRLAVIPLDKTEAPTGEESKAENMFFGRLRSQPGLDGASVQNVDGMSGGPVYGVKNVNGVPKYWVIGIQSGWFSVSRIVCFCLLAGLLLELKRIVNEVHNIQN